MSDRIKSDKKKFLQDQSNNPNQKRKDKKPPKPLQSLTEALEIYEDELDFENEYENESQGNEKLTQKDVTYINTIRSKFLILGSELSRSDRQDSAKKVEFDNQDQFQAYLDRIKSTYDSDCYDAYASQRAIYLYEDRIKIYEQYTKFIKRFAPGPLWMAKKIWNDSTLQSNWSGRKREFHITSEYETLKEIVNEFVTYLSVREAVTSLPSDELALLADSRGERKVMSEDYIETTEGFIRSKADLDKRIEDGDSIKDYIDLATSRLLKLGIRFPKIAQLFSKMYKKQRSKTVHWSSGNQINQHLIANRVQLLSTDIESNLPQWIQDELLTNPYYSLSNRRASETSLHPAVKTWQQVDQSIPQRLATKIGDFEEKWKMQAAKLAWHKTLKHFDKLQLTNKTNADTIGKNIYQRLELGEARFDLEFKDYAKYLSDYNIDWSNPELSNDDIEFDENRYSSGRMFWLKNDYDEYKPNVELMRSYRTAKFESTQIQEDYNELLTFLEERSVDINQVDSDTVIESNRGDPIRANFFISNYPSNRLDIDMVDQYREYISKRASFVNSKTASIVTTQKTFPVLTEDKKFEAITKSDIDNYFGKELNLQIAKGKQGVVRSIKSPYIAVKTLYGGKINPVLNEILGKVLTQNSEDESKIDVLLGFSLAGFHSNLKTLVGANPNPGNLSMLTELSQVPFDELVDEDFNPSNRSMLNSKINQAMSEQTEVDSAFRLTLTFGKDSKRWLDSFENAELARNLQQWDVEYILDNIQSTPMEAPNPMPKAKLSEQYDSLIVKHYLAKYLEEKNIPEDKEEEVKLRLRPIINANIKVIRSDHNYQNLKSNKKATIDSQGLVDRSRIYHDATFWLPIINDSKSKGLSSFLLKNVNQSMEDLQVVAINWKDLTDDHKKLPFKELIIKLRSNIYNSFENPSFANECAKWGIPVDKFPTLLNRFQKSKNITSTFETNKRWTDGKLTARFLKRDDPKGIFLGNYTNCCQHPFNQGRTCAWYGLESKNSGFFVVEDAKGEIVSQSWAWISDDGGLCFDSVESKDKLSRVDQVRATYDLAIADLTKEFHTITFGSNYLGYNSTNSNQNLDRPKDYTGYTDASSQSIAAHNPALPKTRIFKENHWVRGALTSDRSRIEEVAAASYGYEGSQVNDESDVGLILETKADGVVGYALIDSQEYSIDDLAVLEEHRSLSNIFLRNLETKCKELEQQAGKVVTWSCHARETTSFKLLSYLEKKNKIKIAKKSESDVTIDGDKYYNIEFIFT
jgi:hypothetical protein